MDIQQHVRNRNQFPPDELEKYAGRYVAWSPDGMHIVAAADDIVELCDAVDALKLDPEEIVMGRVPLPDEVILGGGSEA